ncbi:hypothetical protein RJV04_005068 [Salmonella enterica]|nr:hypothetical protein [Salmonella enterica]
MLKKFHTAIALGMGAMILAPDAFAYTTIATNTDTATAYVTGNLDVSMTGSTGRVFSLPIKAGELIGTFTIDVTSTDPVFQKAKLNIVVTPDSRNCNNGSLIIDHHPAFINYAETGVLVVTPDSNWTYVGPFPCDIEYVRPTTLGNAGHQSYTLNYSAARDYTALPSDVYTLKATVKVTAP